MQQTPANAENVLRKTFSAETNGALVCVSVCVLTVESGILLSFYYLEDYGVINEEEKIDKVIKLRQEFTFAWYFRFGPCDLELNIERL